MLKIKVVIPNIGIYCIPILYTVFLCMFAHVSQESLHLFPIFLEKYLSLHSTVIWSYHIDLEVIMFVQGADYCKHLLVFEGHTDTLTKTSILLYKCFGLLLWWSKDIFALSVTLLCQHVLIGIALWDVEALLQHVTHTSISAFKKQHYMKQQTLNEVFKSV